MTRGGLARLLCEREGWTDSRGRPAVSSARKVLPLLARKAGFELPEARRGVPECVAEALPPGGLDELEGMRWRLADLGDVLLQAAGTREERRSWDAMMREWHPLGFRRPPGAQIRYWVCSSRYGRLGGLAFSAASWHQKARDEWIGWDACARARNLQRVICNHRFLLIPRVHGLASAVLCLAQEQVVGDWHEQYGVEPVLAYTYMEEDRRGISYASAGWERCREPSSGLPDRHAAPVAPKSVWMRPLSEGWREALRAREERVIRPPRPVFLPDGDVHWADREYARCSHPDGRVRSRIVEMGRVWTNHLGAPLPVLFPHPTDRKAACRLLSNDQVNMEHILEPHQASTVERCAQESLVLAIQDTTALNYHGLAGTGGLVGIGGRGKGAKGILAHFGLAVGETGRPLGVYAVDAGFRKLGRAARECTPDFEKESRRWIDGLERAHAVSQACPGTRVVTVCDREGDIWSMIRQARRSGDGLLVRSNRSRQRRVILEDGRHGKLPEHMARQPVLAEKTIDIEACGGKRERKARRARLALRACKVLLKAPKDAPDQTPTPMLAVSVDETDCDPKHGQKPLHWLLLTTEGEASPQQALRVVGWYEARWNIETWFSVLKNGSRIATRQFDHADDLRKCLVFDAVTACHVHDLNYMARNSPQVPAREVVGDDQVDCLNEYRKHRGIHRSPQPPDPDPDIRAFVVALAGIAGFLPRRSQPLPGTRKLWQAYDMFVPVLVYHRGMNAREPPP